MADGTAHLTETQQSQQLPNSIALICAHAQYVIRRQSAGGPRAFIGAPRRGSEYYRPRRRVGHGIHSGPFGEHRSNCGDDDPKQPPT